MLVTLFYTSGLTEEIDGVISIDSIEEIEDEGIETYIYITYIVDNYTESEKIRADRLIDMAVRIQEVDYYAKLDYNCTTNSSIIKSVCNDVRYK